MTGPTDPVVQAFLDPHSTVNVAQLGGVTPELGRLISELLGAIERPIALAEWQDQVLAHYGTHSARTTRLRMAQALRETLALAGPLATTTALAPELVRRLAARGGAASTINGLLASLRRACNLAIKRGQLRATRLEGACWRVRRDVPSAPQHHPRKEIARVLDWLRGRSEDWDGGRLHALAAVYCYTGLRRTEALRLPVEDVDLRRGFVFVRPNGQQLKTERSAAPVPCPTALVDVLRPWVGRCNSEWLFPGRKRLGPWTGGTTGRRATDRLVAAGDAVGVAGFTPLSLRHSLATHYAGHWGLSEKQIQQILRHTTVLTQRIYIHPDLINLGELVRDFRYAQKPPGRRRVPRRDGRRRLLGGRKRRRPGASGLAPAPGS